MRFGGLVAVDDLSFIAQRGDITALIGPNGAGKTTVFNCITGFYKPTAGLIRLEHPDGRAFLLERLLNFRVAKVARVARTFQNIRLFPGMTVLENLVVAQHNALMLASGFSFAGLFGLKSYRKAENAALDKARYWLDRTGLLPRADDAAGALAYGEQRRLEIARAMCTDPVLLCLDEPAAGLNARESAELNALLKFIRREHAHFDPADRARHERGDGDFRPHRRARLRRQDRRRHAGGDPQRPEGDRGLSRRRGRRGGKGRSGGRTMTQPLLAVRGVKTFYGNIMALKGIDLDVNDGEIVTLIGANGAGKSTLMMTIFGNPRASEGSITFDGRDITQMPSHEIARLRIAQSPEGRRIFPRMSVLENLQMGATVADPAHFDEDVKRVCALFPLLDRRMRQRGGTLSGGEQQMLAIARALMSRPRLLLLDEPSLGLAPMLAQQIFRAIRELNTRDRLTVFLVEQNAFHALEARAPRLCHRQRRDHAVRLGPRAAGAARGARRLSRRRPPRGDRRLDKRHDRRYGFANQTETFMSYVTSRGWPSLRPALSSSRSPQPSRNPA